jgi:hypothetical protein
VYRNDLSYPIRPSCIMEGTYRVHPAANQRLQMDWGRSSRDERDLHIERQPWVNVTDDSLSQLESNLLPSNTASSNVLPALPS